MIFRCPNCKNQLGINIPESHEDALRKGYEFAVNAIIGTPQGFDSYKAEVGRLKNLTSDIAEFTGETPEDVEAKLECTEDRLRELWARRQGTVDFYIDNQEYLYDNVKYNQFQSYQVERLFPAVRTRNQKTLDIGCGIGSLVFILSSQENEAWGWDINPIMVEFCNFKKEKYGLKAHFTTEKPDWGEFDLISALGTFEHFEHLRGFIADLGWGMKRGAKLYHHDDFHDQTISPMHFDHSKEMPIWLDEAGFIEYDERWCVKA